MLADPVLGLQMATCLLCLYMVGTKGEGALVSSFSCKVITSIIQVLSL